MTVSDHLDGPELADRLRPWMEANVQGFTGPIAIEAFAGGHSNPTYQVTTPERRYVLRCKPWGQLLHSAHAVDREFMALRALHPTGFPVPEPYAYCDDQTIIGTTFYVMDLIAGRIFRSQALPGAGLEERRPLYREMIKTLARLHSFDPDAIGLSGFAPQGNYMDRQLNRWIKQYRASETVRIPQMERLSSWLPSTVPRQSRTTIVHGDFKVDNIIFATDRPAVAGLLDWELATLGEPICDLTYFAMTWINGALGQQSDLADAGYPTLEEMTRLYSQATLRTELPEFDWYLAFNYFRLAAILQGIVARALDGTANSPDAASMAERVLPMAELGWGFAQRAGAAT